MDSDDDFLPQQHQIQVLVEPLDDAGENHISIPQVRLLFDGLRTKRSHQSLPLLSIPALPTPSPIETETPETETPISHSLDSPLTGIVDLSCSLKTLGSHPITHGGFSDIYKANWERTVHNEVGNQERITVPVAVKLLRVLSAKDQDGVKARKRLNREVYVWNRLNHPNIATFFGTSYHMAGRPAMVMQWYENGSATDYLKQNRPGTDKLGLVVDVARGLEYLHTHKPCIVHGDLKGNNVLITDDGHAVLSDFGLSQVIDDLVGGPTGWTLTSPDIGPLRWQAPELLIDETCHTSLQTDVWSFGCTAYELLTGRYPYHHRSRDSLIIQDIQSGIMPATVSELELLDIAQCSSSSPFPSSSTTPIPRAGTLWDILISCWNFTPSQRASMVDVVLQLGTCIDNK